MVCLKCGGELAERAKSNWNVCPPCYRAHNARYRATPERQAAQKVHHAAASAAYRTSAELRAERSAYNKAHRAAHRAAIEEKRRAKWAENRAARRPEAVAQWLAILCYKCGRAIDAPARIPQHLQARRQCEPCKKAAHVAEWPARL